MAKSWTKRTIKPSLKGNWARKFHLKKHGQAVGAIKKADAVKPGSKTDTKTLDK